MPISATLVGIMFIATGLTWLFGPWVLVGFGIGFILLEIWITP
jgi:hypothetical protein